VVGRPATGATPAPVSPHALVYSLKPSALIRRAGSPADAVSSGEAPGLSLPGVPAGTGGPGLPVGALPTYLPPAPPPPSQSPTTRVKVSSGVSEGFLLRKVQTSYPP